MAKAKKKAPQAPSALTWTTEKRRIGDLVEWEANPRQLTEKQAADLKESLDRFGYVEPVAINTDGTIVGGHQRRRLLMDAAAVAPDTLIDVRVPSRLLNEDEFRELAIRLNRNTGEWDFDKLANEFEATTLIEWGFTPEGLTGDFGPEPVKEGKTEADKLPEKRPTKIVRGDLFELGAHRLLCGDSTEHAALERLFGKERATLIHADPPYGMGKEAEGILNDNLYDAKLDAFQMDWWREWVQFLAENGSAYIWGNAPDLWRLWWRGGLEGPDLMVRNEIVWDKGSAFGMTSDWAHSYPPATERCLFLMRGQQFLGNQNKEDYFEGYEPLRAWLVEQRDKAGWGNADVNEATNTNMAGHWFSKSQFQPISRGHYETLAQAAKGKAFVEPYDELFGRMFGGAKADGNAHRRDLSAQMREIRSYFDNTHDTMTDVWQFPRVVGEERFGHAAPKPVAMVARAMRSSTRPGDLVAVPFGGTAPEVIAAEQLGRRAAVMELEPSYCQVIIDRWQDFTGKKAMRLEATR